MFSSVKILSGHYRKAIKQAIVGGPGLSVLSRHTLVVGASIGNPVTLNVEHFPIKRKWYAVYSASKQPGIIATTFLEYLCNMAGNIRGIPRHINRRGVVMSVV